MVQIAMDEGVLSAIETLVESPYAFVRVHFV